MTKELAKTLTTALVQWIERERREGTMCCSSYECEKIEKAFEGGRYDVVESLIKKKLTGLTEFEKCMLDFAKARDEYEYDSTKVVELNEKVIELTKSYSKKLLALAKKELLKEWNENMKDEYARGKRDGLTIGYNNGYKDAEKRYNESVAFHYYDARPLCWEPGGTCTNPQMDCVNCPRKTTGGGFNTSSGTSTATLHGNTSITDGKEHNPSFTD